MYRNVIYYNQTSGGITPTECVRRGGTCNNPSLVQKKINYKEIWDLQNVPSPFISDIIEIAKIVFTCIYDEKRETANIETYCKKEACWTVVKNVEYHISDELLSILVDLNN